MPNNLEKQIEEERAAITALDSKLDGNRTPYMKHQLRSAAHHLDDAVDGLRYAAKASPNPNDAFMWLAFVQMNLQIATQIRQKVQDAVDKYGGPEHIIEMGG
jgi:hypothetical protein